jgi:hypothetical protein
MERGLIFLVKILEKKILDFGPEKKNRTNAIMGAVIGCCVAGG